MLFLPAVTSSNDEHVLKNAVILLLLYIFFYMFMILEQHKKDMLPFVLVCKACIKVLKNIGRVIN